MIKKSTYISQRSRGFTLAELLVVVAIIAVLVMVAIPVFGSALEKAKESACMANRRSLKADVSEKLLTDPSAAAVTAGNHSLSTEQSREFTCPDGGTITYWVDRVKGVNVICSKHSQLSKETMSVIIGVVTDLYDNVHQSIDSTALDSGFEYRPLALEKFKAAGIDLDSLGVKTWRISTQYDKMAFQWTTEDITSANAGDKVLVMQYKPGIGYTVWESQVKVAKDKNGGFYNILNDGNRTEFTKGLSVSTKSDFDTIKAIYNEEAVKRSIPPLT